MADSLLAHSVTHLRFVFVTTSTPNPCVMSSSFRSSRLARPFSAALVPLAALAAASVAHAQSPAPSTAAGEDWSFPFTVTEEPYSGLFRMGASAQPDAAGGLVKNVGRTLTWASVNPAEDVYDFSYLENALSSAATASPSYGVIFRLKSSVLDGSEEGQGGTQSQFVPQWVLDKYNITAPAHGGDDTTYSDNDTFHTTGNKLYVAPWHPGVQAEWQKFIREFGRRKYIQSPHFIAIYLHGISKSSGEEMDIDSTTYVNQAANTVAGSGYSSLGAALMGTFQQRMDTWVQAAGAYIHKVIWVGAGEFHGVDSAYNRVDLDNYALVSGLGSRRGFIEHYYYGRIQPPTAGQNYNNGYVTSDWSAELRDGRYWGDENEETDEYGSVTGEIRDFAYKSSFFRAAQVGMNFLWTSTTPIGYAGGIPGWFTKVAGKPAAQSPDAAVWLREAQVRILPAPPWTNQYTTQGTAQPFKNLERLVYQRDITNRMSVATQLKAMPYVSLKDTTNTDEYTARRTDVANGSREMAFMLDAGFKSAIKAQGQPVQIKVHYLENHTAQWTLRVAKSGSTFVDLGNIQASSASNTWKTATFTLTSANLSSAFVPGALGTDIDFAIRMTGTQTTNNLTVRYVRVVRTATPPVAPTIKVQPLSRALLSGATATLHVVGRGPGTLGYQWKKNGTNISGATSASLTVTSADTGNYTVVVSNATGSVTSNTATVSAAYSQLLDGFGDGNYSTPPWTTHTGTGGTVTFSALNTNPSPAGSYYLKIDFNNSSTWKYAVLKDPSTSYGSNWSANGANALRFYLRGNNAGVPHQALQVQIREGDTGERWQAAIGNFARNDTWTLVTVPFSELVEMAGSPAGNNTLDLSAIDQIRFLHEGDANARSIQVDHIQAIQL